jgi:enamine deaminase RidA (YjgF/YER057c/UK114 family)
MNDDIARFPAPAGFPPFSLAVAHNGVLHLSGMGPVDERGRTVPGGFAEQFRATFRNLETVLVTQGSDISRVLKVTVWLTRASDVAEMNRLYAESFPPDALPARTTAVVMALPVPDFLIEIECVAALRPPEPPAWIEPASGG